ncbi:uncharacterized protein LAESUDRAFT_90177 [Laetiporus sulphureus 93-53]|uniref:Uncharacterized protein n=1 Tax=Laetiporus sulphureus 93-53 TaxID=1314785 RepID=A0A165EYC8_9APHY|nr:uncharacterized protein LAESUDRAFT_90177 [Laetiporus sulphureus 93-53]KZT07977.1 hypothetical protein LAESUDRAFT_90177 [Laetiporus sulphureus 93-53]
MSKHNFNTPPPPTAALRHLSRHDHLHQRAPPLSDSLIQNRHWIHHAGCLRPRTVNRSTPGSKHRFSQGNTLTLDVVSPSSPRRRVCYASHLGAICVRRSSYSYHRHTIYTRLWLPGSHKARTTIRPHVLPSSTFLKSPSPQTRKAIPHLARRLAAVPHARRRKAPYPTLLAEPRWPSSPS